MACAATADVGENEISRVWPVPQESAPLSRVEDASAEVTCQRGFSTGSGAPRGGPRPPSPSAYRLLLDQGSISGNVAVSVLFGPDVMVSTTFAKVALTSTGVIWSGHVRLDASTGVVSTSKVPRPERVRSVCVPAVGLVERCRPLGCWSLLPLLMQPVTIVTSADSVAVADVPAPATSPVAVRKTPDTSFVAVTSGVPTKCSPPVCVTEVGPTARAAVTSANVTPASANAIAVRVRIELLLGLTRMSRLLTRRSAPFREPQAPLKSVHAPPPFASLLSRVGHRSVQRPRPTFRRGAGQLFLRGDGSGHTSPPPVDVAAALLVETIVLLPDQYQIANIFPRKALTKKPQRAHILTRREG